MTNSDNTSPNPQYTFSTKARVHRPRRAYGLSSARSRGPQPERVPIEVRLPQVELRMLDAASALFSSSVNRPVSRSLLCRVAFLDLIRRVLSTSRDPKALQALVADITFVRENGPHETTHTDAYRKAVEELGNAVAAYDQRVAAEVRSLLIPT